MFKYLDVFLFVGFIVGLVGAIAYLVHDDENAWQKFSMSHNCKAVEKIASRVKYKCDDNYEVTRIE